LDGGLEYLVDRQTAKLGGPIVVGLLALGVAKVDQGNGQDRTECEDERLARNGKSRGDRHDAPVSRHFVVP